LTHQSQKGGQSKAQSVGYRYDTAQRINFGEFGATRSGNFGIAQDSRSSLLHHLFAEAVTSGSQSTRGVFGFGSFAAAGQDNRAMSANTRWMQQGERAAERKKSFWQ
jgi:hypothetical protein